MLPFGLFFVSFPLLGHLSTNHGVLAMAGLLAAFMVTSMATKLLHDFYDRRYGKAEMAQKNWFPGLGMGLWLIILVRCSIADGIHPRFSLAALWIASFFWGIYMSSSGYRWHYLLLTICFVFVVPYWGDLGEAWQAAITGTAFVAAGLMDHLLLIRLLPLRSEDQTASALP